MTPAGAPTPPVREEPAVRLRHATLIRNLANILKAGLLTAQRKGRLPVVWLCSRAASTWAVLHTVRRHGGPVQNVVLLDVDVPRSWVRRSAHKGLYFCPKDVPPERIRAAHGFAELAGAGTGS